MCVGHNYSIQLQYTLIIILFTHKLCICCCRNLQRNQDQQTWQQYSARLNLTEHIWHSPRSSTSPFSLDGRTTSSKYPNHDRPAELRCRCTVSVEQSFGCSTETGDDNVHFQATTQGLIVPHLMCWQIEWTSTTAEGCCGVFFVILSPDTKLPTYLLLHRSNW